MKRSSLAAIGLFLGASVSSGNAFEQSFTIQEHLGCAWQSDIVHQTIQNPKGAKLRAEEAALFLDGKPVPMQLDSVVTNKAGHITKADVWFRTDLPANGTRSFVLRSGKGANETDLKVSKSGDVLEISNALTAVRLGCGTNGPLLGVKLLSGNWTGTSRLGTNVVESCSTEIVAQGPIFVRARASYRFKGGGFYTFETTMRSHDPLVRFDEQFKAAGEVEFDLGTGLSPSKFATKADFRGNMQLTPIAYDKPNKVIHLVGWDFYLPDHTAVIGFLGGPSDDLLAWMGIEGSAADWLPLPYRQQFTVNAEPGGKLKFTGPLEMPEAVPQNMKRGHRTWGFLIAKASDFPDTPAGTPLNPAKDLYRWWSKHVMVSLDKVVNWQLVWPDMDKIEFPHTFFSKADLPGIRARLQAEPAIKSQMETIRDVQNGWGSIASYTVEWSPEQRAMMAEYRAKYECRKGIGNGISYLGAAYLYFGDPVYLEQINDHTGLEWNMTPSAYLDFFIRCYLDGAGPMWRVGSGGDGGQMGSMNVSDQLLQRYVSTELLLGSDVLTPQEKRAFLTKLAFLAYSMHEGEWQPPVHMPEGWRPEGYGQGTPNQKHCAWSARAITACMLANHPMKKEWMKFAMAELRPHYEYTIHESGALLESPFYSARDTMRYAPFWSAMTRAGVKDIAPDYEQWMNRPKRGFQYLADMLTPKEPRMDGKRVYHPIGRSSPGVVDPTLMIGGDPWGLDDPQHAALMRWGWEQQGKPSPDIVGTTGGRDLALTMIAFSHPAKPLEKSPLRSKRYEGMGAILRSNPDSDCESNILFRHDGFCWDLYAVNNGAVYFYGKGAPLLPRFGAYWSHSYGGAWMMDLPFGNRVEFPDGNRNNYGSTTEFASLGHLADIVTGITDDKDWRRSVLFSKDLDRDDPVYLLVRDDVSRANSPSVINWWFMTKNVAPDGLKQPGVVSMKIHQEDWIKNLGHNWANAPKLTGQTHHFPGMCGVDVDLFIASPSDPQIVTDAASAGNFPYCQGGRDLFETQQLIRIPQPAGKGFLSLLVPRWPNSPQPAYRTLKDGVGVAIKQASGEDHLFLVENAVKYKDEAVDFQGRIGFVRHGTDKSLRLMVTGGRIIADGVTLASPASACVLVRGGKIHVIHTGDRKDVKLELPAALKKLPVSYEQVDSFPSRPSESKPKSAAEKKGVIGFTLGQFNEDGSNKNFYSGGYSSTNYSAGYRFYLTKPLTITHLGVFDWKSKTVTAANDGLDVAIYSSSDGAAVASATVTTGDTTTEPAGVDGRDQSDASSFRFHALSTPATLHSGSYVIISETVRGDEVGNSYGNSAFSYNILPSEGLGLSYVRQWSKAGVSSSTFYAEPDADYTAGYFGPNFIAVP